MAEGATTWDDVLNDSGTTSPAVTPNAASNPTKRSKFVGWNDLLAQTSAAPVTLNARRGGFSGVMPPAALPESSYIEHPSAPSSVVETSPGSSGLSPLLSRIFPQLLKPSERTGSHYEAAPNQPTPDERLGEMVPQSAVPTLDVLNRYAVQPFERVAQAGAKAGGEILEGTVARAIQPIAAPELAAQPTTSMEEMEKRFPTTLGASKGIGKVVGGAVVDPRNWPFFGSGAARPILQRLISVGFTGLMGKGAVDSAHYLHDNWDKLTPAQRAEIGTQSGLSAALAALTATHALGSEAPSSEAAPRPEGYQPSRQGETVEPTANVPPQPQPTAGMPSGRDTSWEDVLRRPAQAQAAPQETPRTQPEQAVTPTATQMPLETTQTGPEPAGQPIKGWDEVLQQPQPAPESSAPGPGSPEYEALRKRVAALEPSGARAGSADALRKQADTLTGQIEAKRNPAISQQNPTARRARIAEGMSQDADYLEKVQRHILAVSDAAVAGTLPQSLTGVRSRAQIEDLLRYDKLPRMTFPNTYITGLLKATEHVPGTASARSVVSRARIRGEVPELYGSEELAAAEKLMQVAEKRGTSTKYMRESVAPYKRAVAGGLDTSEKWQQARQELKQLAGTEAPQRRPEQQIKTAERELIGQKIPGYFPTPKPLADRLVGAADIQPGMSVLEPSAGKGNIADSVKAQVPGAKLDTVEQQTNLRDILALKGHNVVGNDFLEHQGKYDRIVMNPPFEKGQDIEHVRHAYDLLKPGGRVVAVMSEGPFFRNDSKATAFRDWLDEHDGTSEKLPQGSFTGKESERQTGANSRVVILDKPGAAEVTQAPRASVSTARQPVALRSQQETRGEYGGEAVVKTPTSDLPAKYKLVEAQDLTPSHNAETFAPNPSYPPGVQERAYHTSKEAQARVIQQAQNYDPRYTINTNPDAVNGPPIVTPDGTVLGGNSRTMSTQRLYERGQGDTYRDYLRKNAQQFGINPDAVDNMEKPVLVREIPAPSDVEAARRLGSELNKNMTGALGTSERAVSAGRSITPESLSAISGMLDDMGSDASIRDLLRERGRDVLTLLTRDGAITERERPQFIDTSTGGLSEEGKQFAERALLGTVVEDPTLMDRIPKSVINKLDGSLADISSIAPRTDEYNLLPLVREAIAEHADIAARGLDVETHLAQTGMFGPERNPAVDAIVRKLAEKPKAVREAFRRFAQDANADKQGQGFLAMAEQPSATVAFNEAFDTKLTDSEFGQSVLQSLEREAQKGTEYAKATQEGTSLAPDAGLRFDAAEGKTGRTTAGDEYNRPGVGKQPSEQQPPDISSENADPLSGSLFAHTPVSVAHIALNRLNKFYAEKIAEPLIQDVLKTGRTHPEVEKSDPQFADNLRLLDNAPKYFRQKAQAIIRNVTSGLDRSQERLFTLMADVDSRENLRLNHVMEYKQAQNDPAIQTALKKYRPEEQKLTEARKALGGETIDDDYLRRVYDKYTAGINKRETVGKGITAYDRVIRPQRADRFSREAESEYHYQKGLHEFGPAFGTKYVATMIKVARNRAALDFLSKATPIQNGEYLPRQIEYNGKTYYAPEVARDMREGGKRQVETFGTYSPQANGDRYLGPRPVVDALNGLDAPGAKDPSAMKRFFQEQTVGLGFGVPHMFNIMRRVTQSAPGGAVNPVGWARALKVAFSSALKARGIMGVDDPTFDRLAKFGAIASDSEVSSFKKYIFGNLNPANWIRPFSKIGHDILFKPGALDQRARLYIADLVKSQRPELSDSRIAQAVNEQLGNYNRANWTKVQTKIARFVLFPGWDMSSLNWVIRHPIKTSVPPALLIWTANQVINAMGGNRESEKNDFFTIHAGNRAFSTGLINEPFGKALGGTPLRFAQALVEGKSPTRAVGEASRGLATDLTHPLSMLRPDLGAAIEVGTNRERIGGSKEITKSSDFSTPSRFFPNAGIEKLALHAVSRLFPQLGRLNQARDVTSGTPDIAQFAGGNLGVYNYPVTAESRLRKKMAIASDYSQSKSAVVKQNPQAVQDLFANDPDAAVYLAFRPHMQQTLGQLKKIDQAKEMISSSSEAPDRKKAAIAALDKAREQEVANADKVDRAVDMVLKRVHGRHGSGLNTPILPILRHLFGSQPPAP